MVRVVTEEDQHRAAPSVGGWGEPEATEQGGVDLPDASEQGVQPARRAVGCQALRRVLRVHDGTVHRSRSTAAATSSAERNGVGGSTRTTVPSGRTT